MTVLSEIVHELPVDSVSIVRLHGEACIDCGATAGPLLADGYVHTRSCDGGRLGWPIVRCPGCQEARA